MTTVTEQSANVSADSGSVKEYQHFIGGAWTPAENGATFEVFEPYSGEVFARAAAGTVIDAQRAVDAASAAFPAWAALAPAERQQLFLRAARIVAERREEIAAVLARETGCTAIFAEFQQDRVKNMLEQAAGWVYQPKGQVLQSDEPGTFSIEVRKPMGVVASFTPWNGASILAWRSIVFPLVAGNTLVVKPSELAPISAGMMVADVLEEAGFPAGVVNFVSHAPGDAGAIADHFFESRKVRCINFIGSATTARMLADRAGKALKRSVFELGGYNPIIVLDDADIDYAVRISMFSAFFHQGQICMAARKVLVHEKVYDEFLAKLVERTASLTSGDPSQEGIAIGPLINDRALELVKARIAEAVEKGASVAVGGTNVGRVHDATVLVNVSSDSTVSYEETFGPLLVVQSVASAEEAIAVTNESIYGLTASIISRDTYRAFELAHQIETGVVHVNSATIADEMQAPIGGVGDSGWGRTGPHSIDDFSELVWITAQNRHQDLPF